MVQQPLVVFTAGACAAALLVCGCHKSTTSTASPSPVTDTSLSALGTDPKSLTDEQLQSLAEKSAKDMERFQQAMAERAGSHPPRAEPTNRVQPVAASEEPEVSPDITVAAEPASSVPPTAPPPDRVPTRAERISQLAHDLGVLVREEAENSHDPLRWHIALAGLEPLEPGVADIGTGESLSAIDESIVNAARSAISGLSAVSLGAGDPEAARAALTNAAEKLDRGKTVTISHAALCTSVKGFGQYTPVTANTFLAGRAHRVYVYTEVDHFGSRPIRESDRSAGAAEGDLWAVELSQELQVRLAHDDSLQILKPAQSVVQTSRQKRRDFFVWREIELPPTLSVGDYTIKVIVRDQSGVGAPAVAEEVIRLRMVADPSLASYR